MAGLQLNLCQSGLTVDVTATERGGMVDKKAGLRSREVALQCVEVGGWLGPAVLEEGGSAHIC